MPTNMKMLRIEPTGVVYANPTKPSDQTRFKTVTNPKTLNGVSMPNYVSEVIHTENVAIQVGGVDAIEAVSVRIRVSGSEAASARIAQIIAMLSGKATVWETEGVFKGFAPVTPPVVPGS